VGRFRPSEKQVLSSVEDTDQYSANTMIADVSWLPTKPETAPEVVATYCLPSTLVLLNQSERLNATSAA